MLVDLLHDWEDLGEPPLHLALQGRKCLGDACKGRILESP